MTAIWPLLLFLVTPWPGESGILVQTPGLAWRPRPYTSAIVYRPDGIAFTLRRRGVRARPDLSSLRFPQQPSGTEIYVTVEQDTAAYGMRLVVP